MRPAENKWLQALGSLPAKQQYQLALLGFLGIFLGAFILCILLIVGATRAFEWAREQHSPYPAIDDRAFSYCAREAHSLWLKAKDNLRLQDTQGLASESAYQQWQGHSRSFARDCAGQNWPGQAVPQSPAEWLPYSGLTAADWPAGVPANADE